MGYIIENCLQKTTKKWYGIKKTPCNLMGDFNGHDNL